MEVIFLSVLFTAFNVLTLLCVVAIVTAIVIDYGKPKGDKNGNRTDIERKKRNSWRFR